MHGSYPCTPHLGFRIDDPNPSYDIGQTMLSHYLSSGTISVSFYSSTTRSAAAAAGGSLSRAKASFQVSASNICAIRGEATKKIATNWVMKSGNSTATLLRRNQGGGGENNVGGGDDEFSIWES